MNILGISAFYHDSAAALLSDGKIVSAAQEERFSRIKHDASYPAEAIQYCLKSGEINFDALDAVVFYEKPFLKFERILETYVAFAPNGFNSFRKSMPIWIKEKLFQKKNLLKKLSTSAPQIDWKEKLYFSEHHLSHASSAFYPSPFDRAVVLTMDGVGEWATTSVAVGNGNSIKIERELHFPHSIGLLYSAFTSYLGFKVNSGEYKLMGLAPYGSPRFKDRILQNLVDVKADGSFWLNMEYFDYCTGLQMINKKFEAIFGHQRRESEASELTKFHMDIAASIQAVIDEILIRLTTELATHYAEPNLCLAGGVALNCVTNSKVLRNKAFKNVWVQPAAGDAGGAVGCALAAYHLFFNMPRSKKLGGVENVYLGPQYSSSEIESELEKEGAVFSILGRSDLIKQTCKVLTEGATVGWMQGRMEFGPRALGNRSILADPRLAKMQSTLNLKIKFRESFRPFAPSVLIEDAADWFEIDFDSPYMLFVADVKKNKRLNTTPEDDEIVGVDRLNINRSKVPAVTHVDYTSRIQTVHKETNPIFHGLLSRFKHETGCPLLVNTSFNIRGEPIVCSPKDAFRCFMGTDLDYLVVGDFFLKKDCQEVEPNKRYNKQFSHD